MRRSQRLKQHQPRYYGPPPPIRSRSGSTSSGSSLRDLPVIPRSRLAKVRVVEDEEPFLASKAFQEALAETTKIGVRASVFSWEKDGDAIAKEFADIYASADKLPHMLEDQLNSLPDFARRASDMQRKVFEAAIRVAERGRKAPHIKIVNNVDDELTPPIEFHYTNLMYHTNGVPRPDFDGLKGCGCRGGCDPYSKTCSCAAKQLEETAYYLDGRGFGYTEAGTLVHTRIPVFECNAKCGCDESCQNRVRLLYRI